MFSQRSLIQDFFLRHRRLRFSRSHISPAVVMGGGGLQIRRASRRIYVPAAASARAGPRSRGPWLRGPRPPFPPTRPFGCSIERPFAIDRRGVPSALLGCQSDRLAAQSPVEPRASSRRVLAPSFLSDRQ